MESSPSSSKRQPEKSPDPARIRRRYLLVLLVFLCVTFYIWHKFLNDAFPDNQTSGWPLNFYKWDSDKGKNKNSDAWNSPPLVYTPSASPNASVPLPFPAPESNKPGGLPEFLTNASSVSQAPESNKTEGLQEFLTNGSSVSQGQIMGFSEANASDVNASNLSSLVSTPTESPLKGLLSAALQWLLNSTSSTPPNLELEKSSFVYANVSVVTENVTGASNLSFSTNTSGATRETAKIDPPSAQEPAPDNGLGI
nr:unnamed protein product [Spirometra erinaceieuropaei]